MGAFSFLAVALLALPSLIQAADWPGKAGMWNGYERHAFEVDGKSCHVTVPKKAAPGKPWVWRARFPGFHTGADLLLINKFGKHEAGGRGFRNAIAMALAQDMPVLVGLNAMNEPAFQEFVGGSAQNLPADLPTLRAWVAKALNKAELAV